MSQRGQPCDMQAQNFADGRCLRITERGELASNINHRAVVLAQLHRDFA